LALKGGILEALAGMDEGGSDGGPALRGSRRLGELVGKAPGGARAVDHRPVDHDGLEVRARPLRVADRNPPVLAREDGVDYPVVGQRLDIAAPLEFGFDLVDRSRNVDGQHELQIDRCLGVSRRRRRQRRHGAYERRPSPHAHLRRRSEA
jgi:hypothetical protein